MTNIMAIKFMNPLNFWVGDSPERIEIMWTDEGAKDKQDLYFLRLFDNERIWSMQILVDFIWAIGVDLYWRFSLDEP